jgi:hypothetical protein
MVIEHQIWRDILSTEFACKPEPLSTSETIVPNDPPAPSPNSLWQLCDTVIAGTDSFPTAEVKQQAVLYRYFLSHARSRVEAFLSESRLWADRTYATREVREQGDSDGLLEDRDWDNDTRRHSSMALHRSNDSPHEGAFTLSFDHSYTPHGPYGLQHRETMVIEGTWTLPSKLSLRCHVTNVSLGTKTYGECVENTEWQDIAATWRAGGGIIVVDHDYVLEELVGGIDEELVDLDDSIGANAKQENEWFDFTKVTDFFRDVFTASPSKNEKTSDSDLTMSAEKIEKEVDGNEPKKNAFIDNPLPMKANIQVYRQGDGSRREYGLRNDYVIEIRVLIDYTSRFYGKTTFHSPPFIHSLSSYELFAEGITAGDYWKDVRIYQWA